VCVCVCVQAYRGGGEVPGSAAAPPADLPGQTDREQRDGAGEDEESRAADAAAEPSGGETDGCFQDYYSRRGRRPRGQSINVSVACSATRGREEERRPHVHQEPPAEAGDHRQADHRGDQGETHTHTHTQDKIITM